MTQRTPFHRSASGSAEVDPTAMHAAADVQETRSGSPRSARSCLAWATAPTFFGADSRIRGGKPP